MSLALGFLLGTLAVPLLASDEAPAVIERPIQAGESHSFTFQLAAGQFLGAVVEQDGIDLLVEVFDHRGEKLLEMDGPDYWLWEEEVAFVSEAAGPFRLTIRPYQSFTPAGKYRLRVDGPREVKQGDRVRLEAVREMVAAHAANNPQGRKARLEHLEKALPLWTSLGERRRQAEVLHQLMDVLGDLNRQEKALVRFRESMALWRELALTGGQIWTLLQSRTILPAEQARRNLDEALTLSKESGNRFLEMRSELTLARHHRSQPRTAAGHFARALSIAVELRNPEQEMFASNELAYAYDDLGEKQDALDLFEKALALSRELGDTRIEADVLNSLGWLYYFFGKQEEAITSYEQSVEISRRRGDPQMEARTLNNQALVYQKIEPAKARELYERSLELGRELGNLEIQAMAMNNLAFLDLREDDAPSALQRSRSALPLAAGLPDAEVYVRLALGQAHRKLGDLGASRQELEAALRLSREREDPVRESMALSALARTEIQGEDLPRARALLEEGVRILESLRTEVAQPEIRATFLASRRDMYELYTETLMALDSTHPGGGYAAEALRASERTRARSLLDILTEAGASLRDEADPALVERERRLRAEIEELEQHRLELLGQAGSASEAGEINARLTGALADLGKLEAELVASSPRFAALTRPEPLSVTEIQTKVLDGRAVLLEYALGENRSFLWAVSPDSLQT
ncbi:MAG TPA: tetratricopeptide repeat protein, partial [Thermoanaerobaculia bacterium]|nr:tetratricopeptide repeat protein [Thermoanaerobaculia bacterium]